MANEVTTLYAGTDDFWETYRKGRPQVPDSFFERIFDYHAQHGAGFGTVHDAGAGGGVHSARLAERFNSVLVTDVAPSNIETAKAHLQGPKFTFRAAKLEETIDLPPASIDMVYAAAMLHFTDMDKSLAAVAHQLKPGGTFAASLPGFPKFDDAEIQKRSIALFQRGVDQMHQKLPEEAKAMRSVTASGYDLVPIPEAYFLPGSVRIRLNESVQDTPGGGTLYDILIPHHWREQYPPRSRISNSEKIVFETDDDWRFRKDITFLRQYFETMQFDLETEDMKRLWGELDELTGEREVEGRWVVHLILATRK